jgi:hypothetical protein
MRGKGKTSLTIALLRTKMNRRAWTRSRALRLSFGEKLVLAVTEKFQERPGSWVEKEEER